MKSVWRPLALLVLPPLLLAACAGPAPRWTPDSVAPPAGAVEAEPAPPLPIRATLPETPRDAPTGPIPLTRDGAILSALLNNRSIEVARLSPRIAATYVPEARAAFDPALLATVSAGHMSRPATAPGYSGSTGGSSGGSANALQSAAQVLYQTGRIFSVLEQAERRTDDTDDAQGSATLEQTLPTGTLLYLTGTASGEDSDISGDAYEGGWTVGLSQPLLEGAGRTVNLVALRQAGNRAAQGEHVFRAEVIDVVRQVELAYCELMLAQAVLGIREFAVALADEQLRQDEQRFRVGKVIEGDVMASRAEKASRMADLTDAQSAIRARNIALVRLLNPDTPDSWAVSFDPADAPEVAEVTIDAAASERLSLQYRPELAQAKLDAANRDLDLLETRNALLPRLDLFAEYGHNSYGENSSGIARHLDDSAYDEYRVGVQFQAPLLNRAEKARHERARLSADQAERLVADIAQAIAAEVRHAAIEVRRQWERIGATQEALKSRAEQLRVAQGRNAAGKTTNLDLLIVQRDFIQARVDEVTAKVRYIQALTALYAAEGTILERRGVALDRFAEDRAEASGEQP